MIMGKQIGFFMTPSDEKVFLSSVQKEFGPLVVVSNTSKKEREIIAELECADAFNTNLSLVRADDLHDIIYSYVAAQGVFCVDLLNSEVVQFNRCKYVTSWLAPGRLWFEKKTDHGAKSREFLSWANKLLSWIDRNYVRTDDRLHFVGPEAKELSSSELLRIGPPS